MSAVSSRQRSSAAQRDFQTMREPFLNGGILSSPSSIWRPERKFESVVLRVDALQKRYGATEALAGLSFDVRAGEVFGLLGPNGAGKTTVISILATARRPRAVMRSCSVTVYATNRRSFASGSVSRRRRLRSTRC